jgi:hypothetical protein
MVRLKTEVFISDSNLKKILDVFPTGFMFTPSKESRPHLILVKISDDISIGCPLESRAHYYRSVNIRSVDIAGEPLQCDPSMVHPNTLNLIMSNSVYISSLRDNTIISGVLRIIKKNFRA